MNPEEARTATGYGWKFLDPTGCTYRDGLAYQYDLPRRGEKWGPWQAHPAPAEYDGQDCGPGRLHLMRRLSANYAPNNWWPWFAQWRGLAGESKEKIGVRELRLRRVDPRTFWRIIRLGWCAGANLGGAYLSGANLGGANLGGANLGGANLSGAYLSDANLRDANLSRADLTGAYLSDANLRDANLSRADLTGAYLSDANLRRANLRDANLRDANLSGADLTGAYLRGADLTGAYLRGADLTGAYGDYIK